MNAQAATGTTPGRISSPMSGWVRFAAILLINTLVAASIYRRQEFGQLRLAGRRCGRFMLMVSPESLLLLVTGVVFGTVAALFTILPSSFARF